MIDPNGGTNMSGLEKITAFLNADTDEGNARLIEEAELKAASQIAAVGRDGENRGAEAAAGARKKAAAVMERANSQVRADARASALEAKVKLIDEVLAEAKKSLGELSDDSYFHALAALARANKQPGTGEMRLSKADLLRMPPFFVDEVGERVLVSPVPADIENGFILRYGDIEMNCTFDALFAAYREELRLKANDLLFG